MTSEERKEINKRRIIEVSSELFIRQGIATTTLAQIAKEADVVCRTVSNIFGSKSKLVLEDLRYILRRLMEPILLMTDSPEYRALTGLEQVLCVLKIRGQIMMNHPDMLLLVSEIKVWVARSCHDEQVVKVYMDNLEGMYRIIGDSLEKGIRDGSINPGVDKKQALSMLVLSFRAVIQQLAQVKINPSFMQMINVEEQLQTQISIIRAGLQNYEKHGLQ